MALFYYIRSKLLSISIPFLYLYIPVVTRHFVTRYTRAEKLDMIEGSNY